MTVFVYDRKVWKYHELPCCMYINLYYQYIIMKILDGGWSIYTLYSIGKQSPRDWLKYWPAGPWQLIFLVESAENHYCWPSKPVNIFIAMYIKDFILFMNFISVCFCQKLQILNVAGLISFHFLTIASKQYLITSNQYYFLKKSKYSCLNYFQFHAISLNTKWLTPFENWF